MYTCIYIWSSLHVLVHVHVPTICAFKILPALHYVCLLTSGSLLLTAIKLVVVIRTVVGTVAAQYSHDAVAALTPELVRITIRR